MDNLDPYKIKTIDVFKDKSAITKYGKKANSGIVKITTKKKKTDSQ